MKTPPVCAARWKTLAPLTWPGRGCRMAITRLYKQWLTMVTAHLISSPGLARQLSKATSSSIRTASRGIGNSSGRRLIWRWIGKHWRRKCLAASAYPCSVLSRTLCRGTCPFFRRATWSRRSHSCCWKGIRQACRCRWSCGLSATAVTVTGKKPTPTPSKLNWKKLASFRWNCSAPPLSSSAPRSPSVTTRCTCWAGLPLAAPSTTWTPAPGQISSSPATASAPTTTARRWRNWYRIPARN